MQKRIDKEFEEMDRTFYRPVSEFDYALDKELARQ